MKGWNKPLERVFREEVTVLGCSIAVGCPQSTKSIHPEAIGSEFLENVCIHRCYYKIYC